MTLEIYIRTKLQDVEENHVYEVASDSVRAWIDEYNDLNSRVEKCKCESYKVDRFTGKCMDCGLIKEGQ